MNDRERIKRDAAAVAVLSNRERLYAFTDAQVAALQELGVPMFPVNEKRIVARVLEDAETAGWSWFRPNYCMELEACAHCVTASMSLEHRMKPFYLVPVGGEG